jgi:hypothetical protein
MNFVGAGVNATAVGGFVTINIAGTAVVPVTNAQLLTLIGTNAVVPNTWYLVSNAIFTLTLNDTVPILVQGVTTNSVSLSGSGIFLNADYQQIGNYSGVSGFVSNLGVWTTALAPVIGSVVMWNNLNYVNTTGVNGVSSPQIDVVNWTVLSKTSTNGYIQEIDDITYEPSSNNILSREDKRYNKVENNPSTYTATDEAFYVFQWGNNQVQSNIINSESNLDCSNNLVIGNPILLVPCAIFSNTVTGFSQVALRNIIGATFRNNLFDENVTITVSNNLSFENNKFEQNISLNLLNSGTFGNNIFQQSCNGFISNTQSAQFTNNLFHESVGGINIFNNKPSALITNNVFRYARAVNIELNELSIQKNIFDNSSLQIIRNTGTINENDIFGGSLTVSTVNGGIILLNQILTSGSLTIDDCLGTISKNVIEGASVGIVIMNTNSNFSSNKISESLITINTMNSSSVILNNVFESRSFLTIGTIDGKFGESIKGKGNRVSGSTVEIETIASVCEFSSNVVEQDSSVVFASLSAPSGQVTNNTFRNASISVGNNTNEIAGCEFFNVSWSGGLPNSQVLSGGSTTSWINTIRYSIDMSDPTVYDLPTQTLTIPLNCRTWVGTFRLLNSAGLTISKIVGLNNAHATCLFPDSGTLTFVSVAVAGALATEIVSIGGATSYALVNHSVALADKIYITKDDADVLNEVFLTNILT